MNCNHNLRWTLALVLGLACSGASLPSAPAQLPSAGNLPLPPLQVQAGKIVAGTWVRYAVLRRQANQQTFMTLTALEHEAGGQWLELAITDAQQQTMVTRMLVGGHLGAPQGLLKAVVQLQGQRPFVLPAELVGKQVPPLRAGKDPLARQIAKEQVKVPAGTFLADKYRKKSDGGVTLLWLSDQIAGWPLVKLSSPQLLWQLVARGDDGKSRIRGKPQELPAGLLSPPKAD